MDIINTLQALRQELCDKNSSDRQQNIEINRVIDKIDELVEVLAEYSNNY